MEPVPSGVVAMMSAAECPYDVPASPPEEMVVGIVAVPSYPQDPPTMSARRNVNPDLRYQLTFLNSH